MAKKKLKLLSWNVNGIRAIERKGAFDWIEEGMYDVVCMQETKVHDPSMLSDKLLYPDHYRSYWNSAKEKKGYSGTVMYTKEEPIEFINDFGDSVLSKEGRIVQAEFKNFVLLGVYFPNGKMNAERLQVKMDFYEAFLKHVNALDAAGKNVLFCGDVNTAHKEIDLARPKANEKISGFLPEERAWMDKLVAAGWSDTLRMFNDKPELYTWWDLKSRARDRNVGWRIDYFFVNDRFKKNVTDAYIMPDVMGSDHCPVGVEIEL